MSDDPTPLTLPTHLPFPLTITRLFPTASSSLVRGDKILEYTFTSDTSRRALQRVAAGKPARTEVDRADGEPRENDMVGSWECPVDGGMVRWGEGVEVGMKIEKRHASRPVIYIQQACTHPVQLHGLCGICGKELTENDYITPRSATDNHAGPSRFPGAYEMGHDSLGVTVSSNEAKRLDDQTRQNLLRSRRLSLIVDLDQTIIHTTVDPTVGEWLSEIRASSSDVADEGQSGSKKRRGKNPNVVALEDVATFQLEDDLPPGAVRGRRKAMDRWYYTKPRPGLPAFLEAMSELYEMHVYTMGTRTYANAICAAIDPGGKIFGGRILSRDESGSFSSKNLKRLFPTDQSMVVVIDDRSDVWGDIPNLVKVVPYDFFLGIGDINSNLPSARQNKISSAPSPPKPSSPSSSISDASTPPPMTPPESSSADVSISKEEMMDKVQEERPLKKLQERLEREQEALEGSELAREGGEFDEERDSDRTVSEVSRKVKGEGQDADSAGNGESPKKGTNADSTGSAGRAQRNTTPEGSPPPRIPLLNPNDDELDRVQKILTEIHQSFYDAYDARSSASIDDSLPMGCDVELIIPDLKSRVLEGCNIAFSGLIPRHIRSEQSEIWQLAETFGARPIHTADSSMTHCVTANLGTEKTHLAQQMGKWVVKLEWLLKSVALWQRADEREYDWYAGSKNRKDQEHQKGEVEGIGGALGMTLGNPDDTALTQTEGLGNMPEEISAGSKLEDAVDGSQAEAGFNDPDFDLGGWDEAAEKEFEAFLEGSEDGGSEAGGTRSPTSSVTGTPRKRVRYADEEDLPLESHRDPIKRLSFDTAAEEEGESSSRKRKRPILLGPPDDDGGDVKRVQLSEEQQKVMKRQIEQAGEEGKEEGQEERSEAGTEEDEFAKMLAESLDE